MIRKILAAILMAISVIGASAQVTTGDKAFGPKLGYVSHNSSAVAGLAFQYVVTHHVRLSPEIGCAFRNNGEDAFLLDMNVHMPFLLVDAGNADIYPLAGLAFNSWSDHAKSPVDNVDVTSHTNRFGLNLGAGVDLRCSPTLKVNIEAKYTLVKSFSSAYLTAGISYIF